MPSCRSRFLALLFWCFIANAAKLVPVPAPKTPLPVAAFEVNRGQAKPEILFLARGAGPIAFTAQSILFSPLGHRQNLVASNSNPGVRYSDPLPGVVNSFAGSDPQAWVSNIPRYATARFASVYPGIDVEYTVSSDFILTMKFVLSAGVDPGGIVVEIPNFGLLIGADGSLISTGNAFTPRVRYNTPEAFQSSGSAKIPTAVAFELRATSQFGFRVDNRDSALPLQIEVTLPYPGILSIADPLSTYDASGNVFAVLGIQDAAGVDDPYPNDAGVGCGNNAGFPVACLDVAIYKFSPAGELVFVSYLGGAKREIPRALQLGADGTVVVAGATESDNFPVSSDAFQRSFAGPAAKYSTSTTLAAGDFFAAKLDMVTGALRFSTYLGGPEADTPAAIGLGADSSLYFFPKRLVAPSARMPTTSASLQPECTGDPCGNGYVAHLDPSLNRLLYGTYLPGNSTANATLHADGSVYFAGSARAGFPVTPTAYQRTWGGGVDAIIGRLDPTGARLQFATYIGGPDNDHTSSIAVAPDGSVWANVDTIEGQYRLVKLDAKGERLLVDKPLRALDLAVDPDGNLLAHITAAFTPSPNALLSSQCGFQAEEYVRFNPAGDPLFVTFLPFPAFNFDGTSIHGLPIIRGYEVIEDQTGILAGCVVDGARFLSYNIVSPGEIVTIFGSQLGPAEGVAFQLENGRVPTQLGGTRVLVNGEPAPLLYSSARQVNLILPYSLALDPNSKTAIDVEYQGNTSRIEFISVNRAGITVFPGTGAPLANSYPAAALNEDWTINSPGNPAKKGSYVMLFATGGGATNPPSNAGEVTPLEIRNLQFGAQAQIPRGAFLPVSFAGAAPGLVAGVTQINIKLPDVIPQIAGYPRGLLPITLVTPGDGGTSGTITVAVNPD